MDQQLKQFGVAMAVMFGAVLVLLIWASNRQYDGPRMANVVGCWESNPWRVQLTAGALAIGSSRFRTTGLQQSKNHWFIEAEPFDVVGEELRPSKAGPQPGWI